MGVSGLGCVAFSVHMLGPVSSPLGVSDLSLRNPCGGGFFAGFASGFRWCLAVLSPSREVAVLGVAGLGCVAFSVHVLGPDSSPLWVSDLSLRNPAGEGVFCWVCVRI